MKNTLRCVSIFIFTLLFFSFLTVICFAENTAAIENTLKNTISKPIAEPAINIEAMISEKVTEARVSEYYGFTTDTPEHYTYDTSVYLLEYSVSTDYWSNVQSLDYRGLTEAIYSAYPTVYIPLFGDIEDSNDVVSQRVIGYIKLRNDGGTNDYVFSMGIYNLPSEDYINKKTRVIYESIADYINQNKVDVQQVFLIRYPNSLSDSLEKIAVIQTDNDTIILDVSNSLHLENDNTTDSLYTAYSIAEYRERRMELEKDLYGPSNGWANNPAGGNVSQNNSKPRILTFLPYIIVILIIILTVVVVFAIRKLRKQPCTVNEDKRESK